MNILKRIGGHGPKGLIALEIDLNGRVLNYGELSLKKKHLKLLSFENNPQNWTEKVQQAGYQPIVLALRQEQPFSNWYPQSAAHPLQLALGITPEQYDAFVYQQFEQGSQRHITVLRKDMLQNLQQTIRPFAKRWVYLCLSEQVRRLLSDTNKTSEEALGQALKIPVGAVYLFAACAHFLQYGGADLMGLENELISLPHFQHHQRFVRAGLWSTLGLLGLSSLSFAGKHWLETDTAHLQLQHQPLYAQQDTWELQEQQAMLYEQLLSQRESLAQRPPLLYLLDRSMARCPEDLKIQDWQAPPLTKSLKQLSLDFLNGDPDLLIKGTGKTPQAITQFVAEIQALEMVSQVQLAPTNYAFQQASYAFSLVVWIQAPKP